MDDARVYGGIHWRYDQVAATFWDAHRDGGRKEQPPPGTPLRDDVDQRWRRSVQPIDKNEQDK